MMSIVFREEQVKLAQSIVDDEGARGTVRDDLARGLLAEHGEVIAARAKIGDMAREAQAHVDRFVEAERRHVADLAAARGVTARLRAAIVAGGTDAAQAEALDAAACSVMGADLPRELSVRVCAALLALHEEHKATTARLAAVLAGVERVITEARGT